MLKKISQVAGWMTLILMMNAALAFAQESPLPAEEPEAVTEDTPQATEAASSPEIEKAKLELLKAQAEADKAKAEAEKAKAEAEKARLEAGKAVAEAEEEDAESKEGYHKHDGFFLRMSLGFGYGKYMGSGDLVHDGDTYKYTFGEVDKDAGVTSFNLQLGGCVIENLAIYADMWGSPSIAYTKRDQPVTVVDTNATETRSLNYHYMVGGLGLGMTYYFMPHNIYIAGSIGPAGLGVMVHENNSDGERHTSEGWGLPGVGVAFSVGKEWWVSDNWGLGLALQTHYVYASNSQADVHYFDTLLAFSATYN